MWSHLVTLMGNPMTLRENFFVINHCILLLPNEVAPYNKSIQILMAFRDEFWHEHRIFYHFGPFGSHCARPVDPSIPFPAMGMMQ